MTNLVLAKKEQEVLNSNETGTSFVGKDFYLIQLTNKRAPHVNIKIKPITVCDKHLRGQLKQITFNSRNMARATSTSQRQTTASNCTLIEY